MSIMNIIKAAPLFYELYDNEIEAIVEKCNVLSLEKDEFVFREGDTGNDIYIILTGSAEVKKGKVSLAQLRKGDLFGEMVLLNQNVRSADIVAASYCDILVMNYEAIFGFYDKHPKIFSLLILNLSRLLTKRLENSSSIISQLNEQLSQLNTKKAA